MLGVCDFPISGSFLVSVDTVSGGSEPLSWLIVLAIEEIPVIFFVYLEKVECVPRVGSFVEEVVPCFVML